MEAPYIPHALPSQTVFNFSRDGKSIIHPRNLWVRGSNLTGGHYRLSCPRSADTALKPYLTLPSQTFFDFLSQRHKRLCHLIPDMMDYFLAQPRLAKLNQSA